MKKETQCPKCGTMNPSTALHCGNCGNSLSVVCRNCWKPSPTSSTYCQNCGENLSTAHFALPREVAEDWVAKFAELDWHRGMGEWPDGLKENLMPSWGMQQEISIMTSAIKSTYWLVKVVTPSSMLYPKHDGGTLYMTNWRLIVMTWRYRTGPKDNDPGRPYVGHFPYDQLKSARLLNDGPGKWPVFSLDFGALGTVELHRSKMYNFPFTPIPTPMAAMATGAASLVIQRQQADNRLVNNFFKFVVDSRDQFSRNMPSASKAAGPKKKKTQQSASSSCKTRNAKRK